MPTDLQRSSTEKREGKRSISWGLALPFLMVLLALVAYELQSARKQDSAQTAYLLTGISPPR
jgi:hypothetical protein